LTEWRLFPEGSTPPWTTAEWYETREAAPHLDDELHRPRLLTAARYVAQAAMALGVRTVVDLGAGDGGLLSLLGPALRGWGYDLAPANVEASKARGVNVHLADVLTQPIRWGEIAVATEILEHLIDPHGFAKTIAEHSDALVCSSPWTETDQVHYEFHTWAWDMDGYRDMLTAAGWRIIHQEPVTGFQVVLAVHA
jgi:hypothetical protein